MLVDVAYVGNQADGLVADRQLQPGGAEQRRRHARRCSRAGRSRSSRDITYVFNGGKSRYDAFQAKYEWRLRSDMTLLSSLTLSKAKDNGAQSLENQNGNFPGPQDFHNLDAEYGTGAYDQPYNCTTSFVWALPFGHGRRWGSACSPVLDALAGGWQLAGINTVTPGEPVTLTYTPAAAFVVSGIQQDFRGANNYRPERHLRSVRAGGQQSITNWFNKDCVVVPTDPSQPFGNAPRNSVRGPNFWTFDLAASKQVALVERR